LAVAYWYSRDRSGVHPPRQLENFTSILQADPYGGYKAQHAQGRKAGPTPKPPVGRTQGDHFTRRLGMMVWRWLAASSRALTPSSHWNVCFGQSTRRATGLLPTTRGSFGGQSGTAFTQPACPVITHSDLATAINYMLSRWQSFSRFVDGGHVCMTNNSAERRVRTLAVEGRNWTFCGSDRGGERRH